MALPRFNVKNAASFTEAAKILKNNNAAVISGGTDLLHGFKDNIYKEYPELVVSLKSIPGADIIEKCENGIKIGALTTLHDLEKDEFLKKEYTVLAEAAYSVASPQIRNSSTIGGNICQQPRCWYYRNVDGFFDCTRKGGTFCNAQTGHNEIHSIFGSMKVKDTPCTAECPAGNNIPEYFAALRADDPMKAAKILIRTNPLAAITGRVCPHTCMSGCNRRKIDESVSIRSLERYTGDYMLEHWEELTADKKAQNGKRTAIIGSGPAGLAAAYFLIMEGWQPVIYEQMEKAGGMLRYGIPSYRLSDEVLDKQIEKLAGMGIEFRYSTKLGRDISIEELRAEYDSVFVDVGAWKPVSIGLEGEEYTIPAMEMLKDIAIDQAKDPGKTVVVVGGGNVAVDAAVSAKRLGAETIYMVCLEQKDEMPAFEDDINEALEEGVKIVNGYGPEKIIVEDGIVKGIEFIRCVSVWDETGRFNPSYDPGDRKQFDADSVILAVGQRTELGFLENIGLNGRIIETNEKTQLTKAENVYAGGDAATGPASVVKAMAAGHRAADAISGILGSLSSEDDWSKLATFSRDSLMKSRALKISRIPEEEKGIKKEDTLGYSKEEMEKEANRCMNCGCVAASPSDLAPAVIALDAQIETTDRVIKAEDFFAVRVLNSTVLEKGELVTAIRFPERTADQKSCYMKFRQRKAIDFPLISVAVSLTLKDNIVEDARIVLGAAAPVPLRRREAEDFLKGKTVTEETAAAAAEAALKGSLPLGKNFYKARAAKAYVRKAILACSEK